MTTKAKAKPAAKEPTGYVILEQKAGEVADAAAWVVVGVQAATNANVAIKTFCADREGTFKAVPERSWKGGLTIKPVQKTESLPFED